MNIYKVVVHLTEGCKPDVKACAALSRLKVFVWQATADCRGWWNSGTNHAKLMDWKLYLSKWQLIFVQNVNVFENCWSRGEPFKSQVVTMTRNLHQKVIEGHAQSGLLHLDFNLKASFMHTRHFSIFQQKKLNRAMEKFIISFQADIVIKWFQNLPDEQSFSMICPVAKYVVICCFALWSSDQNYNK